MKVHPPLSIIIVALNAERTIQECLGYIENQTYKNISEVLIVDGGSTDSTLVIAKKSKLPIKIIKGGYKNNQEARRAVGLKKAKNEFCVYLDTDNYILDKLWLEKMVGPLVKHKEVIASQTLRYAVPKSASILNRYFGLIGASDPVAYYLGKDDRLSWAFDKWNLRGRVLKDFHEYIIVDFRPDVYPTVGCNGIVFRRSCLLKSNWGNSENYIHTDVFVDVAKLGYTKFAIVKNEIFHNTAENIFTFLQKRRRYMGIYHEKLNKKRRHLTFDPKSHSDVFRLFLFMIFSLTLIEPLAESLRGYMKKRDVAWFLHPIICLGIMVVYSEVTLRGVFNKR